MDFEVSLFIREHGHGYFTVEVLGEPDLSLYTDDVATARDELALVLSDRFERMHPRLLGRYATAGGVDHLVVEVEGALSVEGDAGEAERPTRVSALVAGEKRWLRLHLPRWDLRAWVPRHDDPAEAVRALVVEHLARLDPSARLALRYERDERVEPLAIAAEGAPPIRFVGALRDREMLPVPRPVEKERDDDDDDDEDGAPPDPSKKKPRKKRRPPTPTLTAIGVALHRQAEDDLIERAHHRDREVADLHALVSQPGACVVLIGEPGVGKSTVLSELVHRVRDPAISKRDRRPVYFADASRLIAGDGMFGAWQRQCLDVVQECIDAEVVWYLGDLYALLDAGKSAQSNQNVAMLLGPYLTGGRLTVVAEATPASWARVELRDTGFARAFTPYRLEEPDDATRRAIVDRVAETLADETGIEVAPAGRQAVEALCARFRGEGSRLGQTLHFLRRVVDDAAMRAEEADATEVPPLDRRAVVDRFCAESGLPAFLVRDDLPLDPDAVRAFFAARIIGQREAVERMVDLISVVKAGLGDLGRPLGSFLFVGPTGVGKTEMSKALATFLFGRPDRLVRYDMSEFVTADSVHRFIGQSGDEGVLIAQIRRQPFCVLLLDEIEKAHPAVFDVLLQVLGEARLTDEGGRTADFRNAVVLMTSNLGVETQKRGAGFGASGGARTYREHFLAEAARFFRPEFMGRIDHVVPFTPLGADAIDAITDRELDKFVAREGLTQRDLHLELAEDLPDWLAARGVDERYGARPLKRLIERSLAAPLARHLAGRRVEPGHGVRVTPDGDALTFDRIERRGGKSRAVARRAMRSFLDDVAAIRWQVQQWVTSAPYREMGHAVRLVDRLARDKNFWADRTRAEARMHAAGRDRSLIETFEAVQAQVAGVEDLAYEAFFDRTDAPLEMLRTELVEATAELDDAELALIGRRHPAPDRVALYIQGARNAERWLRQLIETYVDFALDRGWQLGVRVADETELGRRARVDDVWPERDDAAGKKTKRKRDRERPDEDGRQEGRRQRKLATEAWAWQWRPEERYTAMPDDLDPRLAERAHRNARASFVNAATSGDVETVRVMWIEGEHAAAWLMGESGTHLLTGGTDAAVCKVRAAAPAERAADNPAVAATRWDARRLRVLDEGKRQLIDVPLDLRLALEPRLHRLYARCMRAAPYDATFGDGAWRRFERKLDRSPS